MTRHGGTRVRIKILVLRQDETLDMEFDPPVVLDEREARPSDSQLPAEGVNLLQLDKDLIPQALERHSDNRTQAARHLHFTRQTLPYQMRKYGLR